MIRSNSFRWQLPSRSNTGPAANQFDLQTVALHEISEVMGRIGMEGAIINGKTTDTPLDLFNYHSNGVLELSSNGGISRQTMDRQVWALTTMRLLMAANYRRRIVKTNRGRVFTARPCGVGKKPPGRLPIHTSESVIQSNPYRC